MITPDAVLSWPDLFVAKAQNEGEKPKFSATLVFLPGTDLKDMKVAALDALMETFKLTKKEALAGVADGSLKWPFLDDAAKIEKKGYPEGSTAVNVKTYKRPGIVSIFPDPNTGKPMPINDPEEASYGAVVMVSVNPFAFDKKGNKGVSFWMNNLQVRGRSDVLGGGGKAAADEFDADPSAVADLADIEAPTEDVEGGTDLDSLLS